jgi:hypothetical protein
MRSARHSGTLSLPRPTSGMSGRYAATPICGMTGRYAAVPISGMTGRDAAVPICAYEPIAACV